jgi:ribonuclease VapC
MSQIFLLDASAILAFLQAEPGGEVVSHALHEDRCMVSAANHSEVIAKAIDRGADAQALQAILADLAYSIVDVKAEDGTQAGLMRDITRKIGLSLGDRLCLATAQRLQARVLTADRPWLTVAKALRIDVQCIRPGAH